MATKTIGGTDGMHTKPDRHPFSSGPFRGTSKFCKTVGVGPNPGGASSANMSSANASMKTKRALNGPGKV